jgi:hypothetical protein
LNDLNIVLPLRVSYAPEVKGKFWMIFCNQLIDQIFNSIPEIILLTNTKLAVMFSHGMRVYPRTKKYQVAATFKLRNYLEIAS